MIDAVELIRETAAPGAGMPAVSTMPALPQRSAAGEIRLAELLGALSYALDITEGQPAGHCVRCCWIGIHIGQEIGLVGRRTCATSTTRCC